MQTEVAKFANDPVEFPPNRKQRGLQLQSGAEYSFKLDVLRKHPKLLNAVMQLLEEHDQCEASDKAELIEALQSELDFFAEGTQKAKQVFDSMEQEEELAHKRRHAKAVDDLAKANEAYSNNAYNEDDGDELQTRKQLAERESRRLKLAERIHESAIAENKATQAYNSFIAHKNRAAQACVAWKQVALEVKGELDSLLKAKSDRPQTGFEAA
jgi:hypothetical protein